MEPRIIARQEHTVSREDIDENAKKVLYRLQSKGFIAYLAGGCVRDLMLGRKPKDFDIATNATPQQIRKNFSNCRLIGRRFRLAHIHYGDDVLEVATFRAEVPEGENHDHKHMTVEDGLVVRDNTWGTPEEDARRRDFTINALFYDISDFTVIDYVEATEDLEKRLIRSIGDPNIRYIEDPVRMLRAVRFASTLDLQIGEEEYAAIIQHHHHLLNAAPPRLYEEFLKFMYSGASESAFDLLMETGLMQILFPEWSQWLETQASEEDKTWVREAFIQMDKWKKAGHQVNGPLLYALMFGSYHEFLAKPAIEAGTPIFHASSHAISAHHDRLREIVSMPRRQMTQMSNITAAQYRFGRTRGKAPVRFAERTFFPDAVIYFKFSSRVKGGDQETIDWWNAFLKENKQFLIRKDPPTKAKAQRKRGGRSRRGRGPRKHFDKPATES